MEGLEGDCEGEEGVYRTLQMNYEQILSLKSQVRSLNCLVEQRDKRIFEMENEKLEVWREVDRMKETLKELKDSERSWSKERREMVEKLQGVEFEKRVMEKDLGICQKNVERLKRTLKIKNDTIFSMSQGRDGIEFGDRGSRTLADISGLDESPQRFGLTLGAESSYKLICLEAMKIIGVSDTKNFYSKLHYLNTAYTIHKKSQKIIERLSELVIQCSPSNTFIKPPTIHQIWKWITSLVEEYMKLKKLSISSCLSELLKITNSEDPEILLKKISNIFNNS